MKYLELLRQQQAALTEQRQAHIDAMEAATAPAVEEERSSLTDEERASFEEARAEIDKIDAEIEQLGERISELAEIEKRAEAGAAKPTFTHMSRTAVADDVEPTSVRYMRADEARSVALATLERKQIGLSPDQQDRVEQLLRSDLINCRGEDIARRLIVTENDDYRSAWAKLMTNPHPVLSPEEGRAVSAFEEYRAASGSVDTAGGYGVPVLIDPTIILTSQGSLNPFRQMSRVITITTDEWKGVSSAGVSWSFDAEAAEVSDDAPTLAQPSVPVHMARGFIPYSIEVGGDYPGFAGEMSRLLAEGWDELQANVFATGTGTNQPTGIITALAANTNVRVMTTTSGALGAVDVNAAWAALPDRYKNSASWVMNHDVGNEISSFSTSGAGSFFTVNLSQPNAPELKGRPTRFSSYFPDFTSTTGAYNILVVGDFSNFVITERAGMSVELVPHLFGLTNNRPTGQRGWFAHARVGSDSVNDLGFRMLVNKT